MHYLAIASLVMLMSLPGSAVAVDPGPQAGRPFEAAEALFRQDPRWLGSDGAISASLGHGRIFWSFDDTFIATSPANSRRESVMVRNTIAILHGSDPLAGKMEFYWGRNDDGSPAAFFPAHGASWFWTGDALRLGAGPLLVFLFRIVSTPGRGPGFANDGFAVAVIDDPDEPPPRWRPRIHEGVLPGFDAVPGSVLVRDGDYVIALAIREHGRHAGMLARYRMQDLRHGDTSAAQWWDGACNGWISSDKFGPDGPEPVIDDAGSESSIHYDERAGAWVHFATYGFGAAYVGMRTAPVLTGPWTAPVRVYDPPELQAPGPFIYAAMAHPELMAPDPNEVLVTYATNAWDFEQLLTDPGSQQLYWPRMISVRLTGSAD